MHVGIVGEFSKEIIGFESTELICKCLNQVHYSSKLTHFDVKCFVFGRFTVNLNARIWKENLLQKLEL